MTSKPFFNIDPNYMDLAHTLEDAYKQASEGKGKERHADDDTPFEEQEIFQLNRLLQGDPEAAPKYQAMKKIRESGRRPYLAAREELLGAIIQISVAIRLLDERQINALKTKKKEDRC